MRRIRVMLGWLLAGAVVNVAVAWGIAYRYPYKLACGSGFAQVNHVPRGWTIGIFEQSGRTYLTSLAIYDTPLHEEFNLFSPPYWSQTLHVEPPSDHSFLDEVAYGYPFRSFSFIHFYTGDGLDDLIGIPLFNGSTTQYLPAHVIWTGTALNTAVYGGLLLFPLMLKRTVLRVKRRLHGRCIHCAYDLRGTDHLQCPECGTPIKRAKPA